jgi:hypothetical protein
MILSRADIDFIKINKDVLKSLFGKRKDDFLKALVDEKDPIRTEAFKIVVREWDNWFTINENISKLKQTKKKGSYTGV